MSYLNILKTQLTVDEGVRTKAYVDTMGKVTIGIGRNLTNVGLSNGEIDLLYTADAHRADLSAQYIFKTFASLTDNRKAAICNMAFNLGQNGLMSFTNLIDAVNNSDWNRAADSMTRSLWAAQVGNRAQRLAALMRSG